MAKGNASKQIIFDKLKEVFPDAFMESDKILRIPLKEDGEPIEIKVSLTAAKNLLGGENANSIPTTPSGDFDFSDAMNPPEGDGIPQPTEEEKANVKNLLGALGL